ncbi:MAG: aspartate aminotransferase family protein [Bacteroidales bacterium]|nr:aspartate aminotransferase family protein [Bacteroidales bacterium]
MNAEEKEMTADRKTEASLYSEACNYLPGGVSRNVLYRKPHPYYVSKASGCYVTDINGVQRVDFANNIASLIHGHAHPRIVQAVIDQLHRGTAYTIGTEVEIEYARLLCDRVPGFEKLRFVNSGTEAVMAMIKAARAYTGKPKIAKAEGGYHGSYDFAEVSQSASPSTWGSIEAPNSVPHAKGTPSSVLNDVVIIPFNHIEETLSILDRHADQLACVLIDPVPHRIGNAPATEAYITAVYDWTRRNNALLCYDEVICFRVNYEGAQADYPVKPDMTALGKIIGGGFPIGAFAGSTEVMSILNPGDRNYRFPLSGTFSANAISMTAGKTAMEMFDREAVEKLNNISMTAVKQVSEAGKIADIPMCITGRGSMFKVHFREKAPISYRDAYDDERMRKAITSFLDHLYEKGIMIINSCTSVVSTAITQKEVDILSEAMLSGFRHIKPMLKD